MFIHFTQCMEMDHQANPWVSCLKKQIAHTISFLQLHNALCINTITVDSNTQSSSVRNAIF